MDGSLSFFELGVADTDKARTFYGQLFGWEFVDEMPSELRVRRLLRYLGNAPRRRALHRVPASGDAQHRAGRGMALVLRGPDARLIG